MKKKVLLGILTVAACFSLGSTSFAADMPTFTAGSSPSETSQAISSLAYLERDVYLTVGTPTMWYPAEVREVYSDGSANVDSDFGVTPIRPGTTVVWSIMSNGDTWLWRFHVSY
ncbi:hypothetical protein [Paenibacillus sp. IHBB 3054]|uniref:hypothetical protein n=1 Tax=Paenibacillus sp. IHBB 3054 TaxID=3425689 RepID=UPI003F668EB4